MNVELSANELEQLDEALKSWQQEPSNSGFGSMLLRTMLLNREESNEEMADRIRHEHDKVQEQVRDRELKVLLLRAKLLQARSWAREHEPVTPG